MRPIDVGRLVLLGAIWGASFPLMRVAVPAFGPLWTPALRLLFAGGLIAALAAHQGQALHLRREARHYLAIGILNSSIPFFLFSYAALHLPGSLMSTFNATAPLFGMLLTPLFFPVRPGLLHAVGAACGIVGVAVIMGAGLHDLSADALHAAAGCLLAACCYALVGIYMRKRASHLNPIAIAAAGQIAAGTALLPTLPFAMPTTWDLLPTWIALLSLAIFCSALAYLLYYRLIADCGPTRALAVTFLIPLFATLWGVLFQGEELTPKLLLGGGLVVMGTALVTRPLLPRKKIADG